MASAFRDVVPSVTMRIVIPATPGLPGSSAEYPPLMFIVSRTTGIAARRASTTFIPFESVARSAAGSGAPGGAATGGSVLRSTLDATASYWGNGRTSSTYTPSVIQRFIAERRSSAVALAIRARMVL